MLPPQNSDMSPSGYKNIPFMMAKINGDKLDYSSQFLANRFSEFYERVFTIHHYSVFWHQNLKPDFSVKTLISWFCVHTAIFLKSGFKFMTFLTGKVQKILFKLFLFFSDSVLFCLFIFCFVLEKYF